MLGAFKRGGDRGANLVEFAVVMPLLILLLIGIVELGWGLAQQLDVRHKARETLRLAIVDEPIGDIVARACVDDIVRGADVEEIQITTATTQGEPISVTITANMMQLTGLLSPFLGSDPQISSTVEGRIEQESTFTSGDVAPCP
jgi:Flp pilus assembly protein TadG